MFWCITCERVWRVSDLRGEPPELACPTACCNDGAPGALLPYHEVRRLASVRWPRTPMPAQRYALREHTNRSAHDQGVRHRAAG